MAQVSVSIAGRVYRMACEDGQEPHLEQLARDFDARINDMKQSFGEIGDQRLTVMAAIGLADDRSDALRKVAKLEAEVARLQEAFATSARDDAEADETVSSALEDAAERIEQAARKIDLAR